MTGPRSDHGVVKLVFQLLALRQERGSIEVISNPPFGGWGEVFGDEFAFPGSIDRLVGHADVLTLVAASHRDGAPVNCLPTTATTTRRRPTGTGCDHLRRPTQRGARGSRPIRALPRPLAASVAGHNGAVPWFPRRRQRHRPQNAAVGDTRGPDDDPSRELGIEVRRRLEAGEVLADVARWLYIGPATRRATIAVKALVQGSDLPLVVCASTIDSVIAEIDPEDFRQLLALRVEFTEVMDTWAAELRRDEQPPR